MAATLTETVKTKVDAQTKAALLRRAEHELRSEAAIVRVAIRHYLDTRETK